MTNIAIIQGRLTADPEVKQVNGGVEVCKFRVAWSEKYNNSERKLFINCTAWRSTAAFLGKYFHKGQEVIVEGRLETNEWKDRDGNNRSAIEMQADRVQFCGPKATADAPVEPGESFTDLPDTDDDDLPF